MTTAQKNEIDTLYYFWPPLEKYRIADADIQKYFEWSEQGLHKQDLKLSGFIDGFNALVSAKQWRGRMIHELYEPGVIEGTMPYFTLLGGYDKHLSFWQAFKKFVRSLRWVRFVHVPVPLSVAKFISKEMFKGLDEQSIMRTYEGILGL